MPVVRVVVSVVQADRPMEAEALATGAAAVAAVVLFRVLVQLVVSAAAVVAVVRILGEEQRGQQALRGCMAVLADKAVVAQVLEVEEQLVWVEGFSIEMDK